MDINSNLSLSEKKEIVVAKENVEENTTSNGIWLENDGTLIVDDNLKKNKIGMETKVDLNLNSLENKETLVVNKSMKESVKENVIEKEGTMVVDMHLQEGCKESVSYTHLTLPTMRTV